MPDKDKNIFKYNHGEKSLKVAHVIYMDLECLLIKTQSSQNNPEESYTERSAIHEACDYLIDLVTSYDPNKNKHIFDRGKYCTKNLCKDLREQAMEIINFEEKEMTPLTDDEIRYYENRKYCHICRGKRCNDIEDKKYKK